MKTTAEYLQLLKQFKEANAKRYGIQKMGLFGSVARGEHTEDSDVDVLYEGEPNILLRSRMNVNWKSGWDAGSIWFVFVNNWLILFLVNQFQKI